MRRLALILLLPLSLSACAESAPSEVIPVPDDRADPLLALDLASARQTLIDFLAGYAAHGQDEGESLDQTLGSASLRLWADWLQAGLPGPGDELTGVVDVRTVDTESLTTLSALFPSVTSDLGDATAIELGVQATVQFTLRPALGDPVGQEYDFSGPATLIRSAPGSWLVFDVTRDGQSLLRSVFTEDEIQERGGIEVELDSVFSFPTVAVLNLVIKNGSDEPLSLDPAGSGMVFGEEVFPAGTVSAVLEEVISPGVEVQGQLFVAQIDLPRGSDDPLMIRVTLVGESGSITLDFTPGPDDAATETPAPAPSASETASPSASVTASPSATQS
jgi:hypothetical protein